MPLQHVKMAAPITASSKTNEQGPHACPFQGLCNVCTSWQVPQRVHLCIDGNVPVLRQQDGCCVVAVADGEVQGAVLLSICVVDVSSSSNQQQ